MGPDSHPDRTEPPRAAIRAALARLADGLVGRDEQARCLLLAALCGEHVLLIGPPGTAKSALARRLRALVGGRYFERLLTRFTVPEELFGPLSLAALDEGRYLREVDGYLPTATVAFLDEVFKANSAILNALLTLLNERAFDQGAERIAVPLATLVAASNEVPSDESLRAFLDRFLVRCTVAPVSGDAFEALLRSDDGGADGGGGGSPGLSDALRCEVEDAAGRVALPASIVAALDELRSLLAEGAIEVTDRRWVRTVRALRFAAATEGRDAIAEPDLWLLRWLLALDAGQAARIETWVADRLGGARGLEPARLARVAQAWDKQLEIEQTATELAFDDSGKLALAKGLGGADEGTMSDAAPRMSAFSRRRRFSATHVHARLAQLDALLAATDAWLDGAAAHRASVAGALDGALWIDPGFASTVLGRLEAGERAVRALRGTMAGTRTAFAALPLSETDDGRIPEPVPA
ncbi:MAG: AAA family ATPase [Burkholderiales bacterium]